MRAVATDGRTYIVELSEWSDYDPKRPNVIDFMHIYNDEMPFLEDKIIQLAPL